ncbi:MULTISPECIES: sugar phosphate isomerase/epimerase [unclassified Paenibacillus]|uniref:sugar phosphate isomerase/epimerase family protein n=1 Tax=unclassified Paenibacillus TaxID=185978 RepID=UPI00061E58A9|nr:MULTISPECIES: sugar phosphate isomerase/epimerase [unclassified Paenibacillus]KKC47417.1 sugar phosphate isomerase [Paenibacillus sp. D9]
MEKLNIGLQLFTLRDETARDFEGTLRKVAELGYKGVEFAGYGDLSADKMKALLDELGLQGFSSHVSLQALREDLQKEIDYLKAIGAKYMICPYLMPEDRPQSGEEWSRLFAELQQFGLEAGKQGLIFGYHNHDFEFHGQVGGDNAFDAMFKETTPEAVQVEMDVCWVQFAGRNPVEYIGNYAGRLPLLHLKDFSADEQGQMKTLELGQGTVDLPAVIEAAAEAGVQWLIVEQDVCQNPPLESISNSYEWLKSHYLNV